ncbi:hypothetical protein UVI_02027140 [Ustilaginoidea virens]|uniref:Uncharacterized protein n=1 Tax=Ustilaginoidea virens TaxID=1159556 RepID=A0A1B5L5R4_USTVR|nr:hypothetical protein UVI_02027140 [Ustilaginoidea virens]
MILNPSPKSLEESVDSVDLGFQFESKANAAAWLLSCEINAGPVVPSAPGTRRLGSVALDLSGLAQLTTE